MKWQNKMKQHKNTILGIYHTVFKCWHELEKNEIKIKYLFISENRNNIQKLMRISKIIGKKEIQVYSNWTVQIQ